MHISTNRAFQMDLLDIRVILTKIVWIRNELPWAAPMKELRELRRHRLFNGEDNSIVFATTSPTHKLLERLHAE